MKLKEIVDGTVKLEEPIAFIFNELYEENLSIDLDGEDLETILNLDITTEMIKKIKTLIATKPDEWDYFNVMRILGI